MVNGEQEALEVARTEATPWSNASIRPVRNRDGDLCIYESFPPRGDNFLLCAEACVSLKRILQFNASTPNLYKSYPAAQAEPRVGSIASLECLLILNGSGVVARRFGCASRTRSGGESGCFRFKVCSEVIGDVMGGKEVDCRRLLFKSLPTRTSRSRANVTSVTVAARRKPEHHDFLFGNGCWGGDGWTPAGRRCHQRRERMVIRNSVKQRVSGLKIPQPVYSPRDLKYIG